MNKDDVNTEVPDIQALDQLDQLVNENSPLSPLKTIREYLNAKKAEGLAAVKAALKASLET